MSNNIGRTLTIRVTITDNEKSKWIWENHKNPELAKDIGVDVGAISDGDMFAERDKLDEALDKMFTINDDNNAWDLNDELDRFYKSEEKRLQEKRKKLREEFSKKGTPDV